MKCDPNYIIHFHDNDVVTLSTDMSLMRGEIERYEGKDGWERFLRFMKEVSLFNPPVVTWRERPTG